MWSSLKLAASTLPGVPNAGDRTAALPPKGAVPPLCGPKQYIIAPEDPKTVFLDPKTVFFASSWQNGTPRASPVLNPDAAVRAAGAPVLALALAITASPVTSDTAAAPTTQIRCRIAAPSVCRPPRHLPGATIPGQSAMYQVTC